MRYFNRSSLSFKLAFGPIVALVAFTALVGYAIIGMRGIQHQTSTFNTVDYKLAGDIATVNGTFYEARTFGLFYIVHGQQSSLTQRNQAMQQVYAALNAIDGTVKNGSTSVMTS